MNEILKLGFIKNQRVEWLKKELQKLLQKDKKFSQEDLVPTSIKLYEKGYSGIDLIYLLENSTLFKNTIPNDKRYEMLFAFHKIKKEFRNEKILMMFILNFLFLHVDFNLENISFM